MRLLLFNPETEYALASGASFYTPPAAVERMRRERALLPEAWAEPDDYILVDAPDSLNSRFQLVSWNDLSALFHEHSDIDIEPWGWNPALIRRMKDCGVPMEKLPDAGTIDLIRSLAHRRTTIRLNTLWNEKAGEGFKLTVPVELNSVDDCMSFYHANNHSCWLKAPWSSSGRGVINTAADMTEILVEQWCRGIIRRQGSVMGETGADRMADYATEWRICSGQPIFLGLSSFTTSNRGKYITNSHATQSEMRMAFDSQCRMMINDVVGFQKEILESVLIGYEGLCGVDMLVEHNGNIRPFVELNLRRTMGMLYIK